jgi:DNA-binding transcriptional MocR family regulator
VRAAHPRVAVTEDDHASLLAGTSVYSACAERDRWVNIRSVSKSLGPDLRLAVLAGDEVTIARVAGRQAPGTRWVSYILQEAVADLRADPAVAAAAAAYSRRRQALMAALAGEGITVTGGRSGLTCWVPVADEDTVTAAVAAAGWAVAPGRRFRIAAPPGIRICFATLDPSEAGPLAAALATALRSRASRLD